MKNIDILNFTDYFGNQLPAGKIHDRETRLAIVKLYIALSKAQKGILEELETARQRIMADNEDAINLYLSLKNSGNPENKKKAQSMTECVQADEDFTRLSGQILQTDYDHPDAIPKISLGVLYEALSDCGFPNLGDSMTLGAINDLFRSILE